MCADITADEYFLYVGQTTSSICFCMYTLHAFLCWLSVINECDLEYCSHSCENLVGGYTCSCPTGYTLAGGRNCIGMSINIVLHVSI